MKTDTQIIDDLIRREGSTYTDRAADRGGPTKYGITLATLRRVRRNPALTGTDVEALTEVEAREIYRHVFIVSPGFYRIQDEALRAFVVDSAVQHSAERVVGWLQTAVKVTRDGDFGPRSAMAVNASPLRILFAELVAVRVEFYGQIIAHDPKLQTAKDAGIRLQAENALGWARRAAEFIRETAVL